MLAQSRKAYCGDNSSILLYASDTKQMLILTPPMLRVYQLPKIISKDFVETGFKTSWN